MEGKSTWRCGHLCGRDDRAPSKNQKEKRHDETIVSDATDTPETGRAPAGPRMVVRDKRAQLALKRGEDRGVRDARPTPRYGAVARAPLQPDDHGRSSSEAAATARLEFGFGRELMAEGGRRDRGIGRGRRVGDSVELLPPRSGKISGDVAVHDCVLSTAGEISVAFSGRNTVGLHSRHGCERGREVDLLEREGPRSKLCLHLAGPKADDRHAVRHSSPQAGQQLVAPALRCAGGGGLPAAWLAAARECGKQPFGPDPPIGQPPGLLGFAAAVGQPRLEWPTIPNTDVGPHRTPRRRLSMSD